MRWKFWKKEKIEQKHEEEIKKITELEEFCGDDRETYEALFNTMFLDPRRIGITIEEAYENAKKFEKNENFTRAAIWYKIAGGLAIYKGDVKKVKEYFRKCEEFLGVKFPILKNPEKAISKAQEFYQKYLK